MKKFKTKKHNNINELIIFIIIILTLIFLYYFKININNKVINIASSNINYISTMYIKKSILPLDYDLNKLVEINMNDKNEILYVDINYNYSYEILNNIVNKIQEDILNINEGNFYNEMLKSYKNNIYINIPLLLSDNSLFSNIGPKIPIKITFYEYVLGSIDCEIQEYGINNVMMKIILNLELTNKFNIPFKEDEIKNNFSLVLSTKILNGIIPEVYGGIIKESSSLMNID